MVDTGKLSFKNKDTAVMIAVILVFLVFARYIYGNQMVKYNQLKARIGIEQEKSGAIERIMIINEKIKKFRERSWDTKDSNLIIDKIFKMGLDYQIRMPTITPQEKKDEKNYVICPFQLSCEGSYKDLLKFIKRLETNKMLLRVNLLDMQPQREQGVAEKDNILRAGLTIEAIYFKW